MKTRIIIILLFVFFALSSYCNNNMSITEYVFHRIEILDPSRNILESSDITGLIIYGTDGEIKKYAIAIGSDARDFSYEIYIFEEEESYNEDYSYKYKLQKGGMRLEDSNVAINVLSVFNNKVDKIVPEWIELDIKGPGGRDNIQVVKFSGIIKLDE